MKTYPTRLVDLELERRPSPHDPEQLRVVETALDRAEAHAPEAQGMMARLEEMSDKLDALLAAVRALPKAEA